jgi:hypothetical protein
MATFPGWQQAILKGIGAPITKNNIKLLNAWARAEGGTAAYNPLNTTQPAPGASSYNSVGVRNFRDPQQGVQATVKTLLNGYYPNIVDGLRNDAHPRITAQAIEKSPWGTGGGVLNVLGTSGSAIPDTVPTLPTAAPQQALPKPPRTALPNIEELMKATAPSATSLSILGRLGGTALRAASSAQQPFNVPEFPTNPAAARAAAPIPDNSPLMTQAKVKHGGGGITELFYDPIGGIKNGASIGAIGGHSDHVHASMGTLQAQLAVEAQARKLGLHVGEERSSDVHPVHVKTSYHYQTWPGTQWRKAADISGDPRSMAALYNWVAQNYGG